MRWAWLPLVPLLASAAPPRFVVENSDPELTALARELPSLCEQWYPKIAGLLYGAQPPAPPAEVRIVFDEPGVAGRTEGYVIHLSPASAKLPAKLDFRAVVIHELVHIVQSYPVPARCDSWRILPCLLTRRYPFGPTWVTEGLADFITYTHFTGSNQPLLRLTPAGLLTGYDESIPYLHGLQQSKRPVDAAYPPRRVPAGKGYEHGYTVAASFLLWLEQNKDPQIIRKLNSAMRTNSYRARFWTTHCGAPLGQLWASFLRASGKAVPA